MITLYGIPNCDTMKKTRKWLAGHDVDYDFHDYKKKGVNATQLQQWIDAVGWEVLLNRRGMMWRKLSEEVRTSIDEKSAVQIMLETPSIIKRPVLVNNNEVLVGFNETEYSTLIQ